MYKLLRCVTPAIELILLCQNSGKRRTRIFLGTNAYLLIWKCIMWWKGAKKKKKIATTPVEAFTYKLDLVKYISTHKRQTNQVFGEDMWW